VIDDLSGILSEVYDICDYMGSFFLSFLHVFSLGHVYILFAPAKKVFWLRHHVFSCRIIAVKPQRLGEAVLSIAN